MLRSTWEVPADKTNHPVTLRVPPLLEKEGRLTFPLLS